MNLITLFIVTGLLYVIIAVSTVHKNWRLFTNKLLLISIILIALWSFNIAAMHLATDAVIAAEIRRYAVFMWGIVFSLFAHFVLLLVSRHKRVSIIQLLALYIPASINIILYYPNTYLASEFVRSGDLWRIEPLINRGFIWDYYFYFYSLACFFLSIRLSLKLGKSDYKRNKVQSIIIRNAIVISLLIAFVFEAILPLTSHGKVEGSTVLISSILIASFWYVSKYVNLFDYDEEEIMEEALTRIDEGVLIVNSEKVVIKMNQAAKEIIGEELDTIKAVYNFEEDLQYLSETLERTFTNKEGIVEALITIEPINDKYEDVFGYMIFILDITQVKKIQHELEVLNDSLEAKVNQRTGALTASNKQLMQEVIQKEAAEDKALRLSMYDALTGLPNKRYFDHAINDLLNDSEGFAVTFMDVDLFKSINDTLGHSVGDEFLKLISSRLERQIHKDDGIARVGGDEFLFLHRSLKSSEDLENRIAIIKQTFDDMFEYDHHTFYITVSLGTAIYPDHGLTSDSLIQHADIAMYASKAEGRHNDTIFSDILLKGINRKVKISNAMHGALEENKFKLFYQAQVDVEKACLVGFEALIRWTDDELGFVSPGEFITIAEENGLIIPIGYYVTKTAVEQLKKWHNTRFSDIPIAVNLSVKQLKDYDLLNYLVEEVKKGLDPKLLSFEITESGMMEDSEEAIGILNKMNTLGFSIAVDDFGQQYSSLNHIKVLPLSKIKIDKAFVDDLDQDSNHIIVKTILYMARGLGADVVAEGIETKAQLQVLKELECYVIQGYYFFKPMAVEQLETIEFNEEILKKLD